MWHLENDGLSSASFSISITRRTFNNMYSSDCYIPSTQLSSQTSAFFTVLGWAFRVSQSTIMEPPRHGLVSVIYLKGGLQGVYSVPDPTRHSKIQPLMGAYNPIVAWICLSRFGRAMPSSCRAEPWRHYYAGAKPSITDIHTQTSPRHWSAFLCELL